MMINTQNAGCFIAPVDYRDNQNYGLFASNDMFVGERLFTNGIHDVPHEKVCKDVGVQPQLYPPNERDNIIDASHKANKAPRRKRHIHSFLQNIKDLDDENDFGSYSNNDIKWVDLASNRSPTLFINSVTNDDGRTANIIFEIELNEYDQEVNYVTVVKNIKAGDEILCDYMLNRTSSAGSSKRSKRNNRQALASGAKRLRR